MKLKINKKMKLLSKFNKNLNRNFRIREKLELTPLNLKLKKL
jgi:hypothetical protein